MSEITSVSWNLESQEHKNLRTASKCGISLGIVQIPENGGIPTPGIWYEMAPLVFHFLILVVTNLRVDIFYSI